MREPGRCRLTGRLILLLSGLASGTRKKQKSAKNTAIIIVYKPNMALRFLFSRSQASRPGDKISSSFNFFLPAKDNSKSISFGEQLLHFGRYRAWFFRIKYSSMSGRFIYNYNWAKTTHRYRVKVAGSDPVPVGKKEYLVTQTLLNYAAF